MVKHLVRVLVCMVCTINEQLPPYHLQSRPALLFLPRIRLVYSMRFSMMLACVGFAGGRCIHLFGQTFDSVTREHCLRLLCAGRISLKCRLKMAKLFEVAINLFRTSWMNLFQLSFNIILRNRGHSFFLLIIGDEKVHNIIVRFYSLLLIVGF